VKKLVKHGIKIVLESNGCLTAMLIILVKKPVLILLDKLMPDEEEK
jgi:response regulator of citrate/malate metabolism